MDTNFNHTYRIVSVTLSHLQWTQTFCGIIHWIVTRFHREFQWGKPEKGVPRAAVLFFYIMGFHYKPSPSMG